MKNIVIYLLFAPVYLCFMIWTFGTDMKLLMTVNGIAPVILFSLSIAVTVKKEDQESKV